MANYRALMQGDPAPWFQQRSTANPAYHLDAAAGRWILLCFLGSAGQPGSKVALAAIEQHRALFDDDRLAVFGVSVDRGDESEGRLAQSLPGIRHFWDFDLSASRAYGAAPVEDGEGVGGNVRYRPLWALLDPTLRLEAVVPFAPGGAEIPALFAQLATLPPVGRHLGFDVPPPILVVPHVFEPAFCRRLTDLYETHGGEESGFMREVDGKTVPVFDYGHKRRADYTISDEKLIDETRTRIRRRVAPEIMKVHQFKVTRMERYIVACYDSETGGHFRAHRDNTTKGTAHRRFAVSINLNDAFEGGEVSFPEYGPRGFKAPPGGAVVFSCSLLHAVSRVTAGKRYAFLPFLYDEEAAKVREANNRFLDEKVGTYRAATAAPAG